MIFTYTHLPSPGEDDSDLLFDLLMQGWTVSFVEHTAAREVRTPNEGMLLWREATHLDPAPEHKFRAASTWSSTVYWFSYAMGKEWVCG